MSNILTKKELIERVHKKYNFSKKEIDAVLTSCVKFIHHLVEKDVVAIELPYIGHLYFYAHYRNRMKYLMERREKWGVKHTDKTKEKAEIAERRYEIINEYATNKKNAGEIITRRDLKHFCKPKMKVKLWNCGKKIDEIEIIQNER